MISIKQIPVKRPLARYVRKISVFESTLPIEHKHRLIPSGCTYLSYNHKEIPSYNHINKVKPTLRLQFTGPKTDSNICVEYEGELLQILIEFTPTGFYYMFHSSPASIRNRLIDPSQFVPEESVNILTGKLLATDDPNIHIDFIQDYLIGLSYNALPFCDYIEKALRILENNIGKNVIKDIARAVHKSERQFNRQFIKIVGISPKVYAKLQQLHYVINLMNLKELASFKEISYSANFYDQSHFDRRFKELVGITPNEFLKSKEHNALKYFTDLVKIPKAP
jgi:AraC-like DNA-binding protein